MTVVSVSRVAAHRWSPNDRNIGTINSPLAAGSAIEVDRLPVLVNHPRPLLHERGAGGQLAHLSSGHQSCKRTFAKFSQCQETVPLLRALSSLKVTVSTSAFTIKTL